MKTWMPLGVLALGLLAVMGGTAGAQKKKSPGFGWHTDYRSAREEARRAGKPIFLVFRCEP